MATSLGAERFVELVATTLEKIEPQLIDQVLLKHPTLDLFREHSGSDEGRSLVLNLEAGEDDSTVWTDSSGSFNTDVSADIITAAEYDWSEPLVSKVRLRFKDIEMNSGSKTKLVERVKAHIEAAKKGHAKKLAKALHAPTPAAGAISSFPVIVSDTGTVGGIDPSGTDKDYWKAVKVAKTVSAESSIQKVFRTVENELDVANSSQQSVSHIIAGRNIYEEYVDSFDDRTRYVGGQGSDGNEVNGRFRKAWFGDIEVRLDPDCEVDTAYFLDMDTWRMKYLNENFMKVHEAQKITGTLDYVTPVASVLALGTSERRANAILTRGA